MYYYSSARDTLVVCLVIKCQHERIVFRFYGDRQPVVFVVTTEQFDSWSITVRIQLLFSLDIGQPILKHFPVLDDYPGAFKTVRHQRYRFK